MFATWHPYAFFGINVFVLIVAIISRDRDVFLSSLILFFVWFATNFSQVATQTYDPVLYFVALDIAVTAALLWLWLHGRRRFVFAVFGLNLCMFIAHAAYEFWEFTPRIAYLRTINLAYLLQLLIVVSWGGRHVWGDIARSVRGRLADWRRRDRGGRDL